MFLQQAAFLQLIDIADSFTFTINGDVLTLEGTAVWTKLQTLHIWVHFGMMTILIPVMAMQQQC